MVYGASVAVLSGRLECNGTVPANIKAKYLQISLKGHLKKTVSFFDRTDSCTEDRSLQE